MARVKREAYDKIRQALLQAKSRIQALAPLLKTHAVLLDNCLRGNLSFYSTALVHEGIEGEIVTIYIPGPQLSYLLIEGNLFRFVQEAITNN